MTIIYHAFHQPLKTIQKNLQKISEYGYTSIQIPPMHLFPLDSDSLDMKNWFKCYQPLSFTVGNVYGSATDLSNLCQAAHALGIKIIVDVCFNFVAPLINVKKNQWISAFKKLEIDPDSDYFDSLLRRVCEQSPQFDPSDFLPLFSGNKSLWFQQTLPAINKSSPKVQQVLLKFLQQLIQCGVDGFRFDCGQFFSLDELHFFLINIHFLKLNPESPFISFKETQLLKVIGLNDTDSYVEIISEKDSITSKYSQISNIISFKLTKLLLNVFSTDQYHINDLKKVVNCCKSTDVGFAVNHDTNQNKKDGRGIGYYDFRTEKDMYLAQWFLIAFGHSHPLILDEFAFSDFQKSVNRFANFCHDCSSEFVEILPAKNQNSVICFKRQETTKDGKTFVKGFCLLNLSEQRLNIRKIDKIHNPDQVFYLVKEVVEESYPVTIQSNGSVSSGGQKQLRINPRTISIYVDSSFSDLY